MKTLLAPTHKFLGSTILEMGMCCNACNSFLLEDGLLTLSVPAVCYFLQQKLSPAVSLLCNGIHFPPAYTGRSQ
jgi:hypothetical protein